MRDVRAIVTERGAGCDGPLAGVRWFSPDETPGSRTAKSCGPGAATVASSRRTISGRRRWQTTPLTGESTY